MITPWINPRQWVALKPPAWVLALGKAPRSAANWVALIAAFCVTTAARYKPDHRTWCNIFVSDVCGAAGAPLPHVWDIGDGHGEREMSANDMIDGLRGGKFPGWKKVDLADVANRAALGLPTVLTFRNSHVMTNMLGEPLRDDLGRIRYASGHITVAVPTPAGKKGIYTTGAGRQCVDCVPLGVAFGPYVSQVEAWGHD